MRHYTIGLATTIAYRAYNTEAITSKHLTILSYLKDTKVLTYEFIANTKQQQLTPSIAYEGLFVSNLNGKIYATQAYIKFLYDIIIPKMDSLGLFNKETHLIGL